jgi:hypothetical protein
MNVSWAKLLLKIAGSSFIILAFLPLMFPQLFFGVYEINYRVSHGDMAGYKAAANYYEKMLKSVYEKRDLSVFILAALLFSSGVITALIGCVLKNDKNS